MKRWLAAVMTLALAVPCLAQYVPPYVTLQGTLASANGMPAPNYSLSFTPNQLMFIGGTATVVSGASCATDANGAVVGVRNPLTPPIASPSYTSGTLPPAMYWVAISWYDSYGKQTLASPPATVDLTTSAGSAVISPPAAGAPTGAVGMNVYMGTSSSGMVYQGQTASTTATYTQSVPLATGAATPTTNATACHVVANDAGWPTGTGYNFSMVDASGNTSPGYPVLVQFLGPGSTYNVSNGLPIYNGRVIYPVPLLTQPYNHNLQQIAGPLSLGVQGGTMYDLVGVSELGVGTTLPAWGVDVEGSGLAGAVNALSGYLVAGDGGAAGQCLASDGSYFDTPVNCLTSVTQYYQTVDANGTGQTQRPALNFGPEFTLADSSSPARTTVDLATQGGVTPGSYTLASVTVNSLGLVTAVSSGTAPSGTNGTGTAAGCRFANDGNGLTCGPVTVTLGTTMPDTGYTAVCAPEFSSAIATTTSAMPSLGLSWTVASTSAVTVYEALNSGSSTGYGISASYGVTVTCIAHHN